MAQQTGAEATVEPGSGAKVRPFSMLDKLGYTLGDLGCCCTEQFRSMYLSTFYILVLQINPVHVGILLLGTKIWDAVNDPLVGALVDMHRAKPGKAKFIPWIRLFSFPMAVLCVLGFINASDWDYAIRIGYCFITYVLYEFLYTCVNVPFGSLSAVMTEDPKHRTALSRYRSLGGTIFMTVLVMVGPLFLYVDNNPVPGRFLMLASICALLGFLFLQVTCVWCKERVIVPPRPKDEKFNWLEVIKKIGRNRPLIGVIVFSLLGIVGASVVNGLNVYLFRDYFGNVKLQSAMGGISTLFSLAAFFLIQPLATHFGKKEWCVIGAGVAAAVMAVLFFFPLHDPTVFIGIYCGCYLFASAMQILVWALLNDAIDYHEYMTGERSEGVMYSAYSFFRKLANAVSGSLSAFILGFIGYNVTAGAVQTQQVIDSIWSAWTGSYAIGYGLAAIVLALVYPLTKSKTEEMLAELKRRRAERAARGEVVVQDVEE